jgi:hypothetical protein
LIFQAVQPSFRKYDIIGEARIQPQAALQRNFILRQTPAETRMLNSAIARAGSDLRRAKGPAFVEKPATATAYKRDRSRCRW